MVREFLDMFPKKIPGLPSKKEADFETKLEPRASPISKPPYRIAPAKLKELKVQLEDLPRRGYKKPSVSPWGAPVDKCLLYISF